MAEEKDLAALVRDSRSYRRFDGTRPVGEDMLRGLVDVARFAPTGNNTQTLRFALVADPAKALEVESHHHWAALLADWDGPVEGEKPTAYIAVCAPAGASKLPIRNLDAGIAAQTIMLDARSRGLVGCMIKSYDAGIDEVLGVAQKGYECLVLLALGWPAADERVVLEEGAPGKVAYWREGTCHHVPKLGVDDLLVG